MRQFITPSVIALSMTLIAASPLRADLTISTDTTQNGGTLVVDPAGTLTVSNDVNNPLLTLTNGAGTSGIQSLIVGKSGNEQGQLLVGSGSILTNSGNGVLGYAAGALGTAVVTGSGSKWLNSGELFVSGNYGGDGILTIEDGGLVTSNNATLGYVSSGKVTVTGAGSKWQNDFDLNVGDFGRGTMIVENGGLVTCDNGTIGSGLYPDPSTATVTGSGSKWQIKNVLEVGNNALAGFGALKIEDGGLVTDVVGNIGGYSTISTVTVIGQESKWENSKELYVANGGGGTLSVKDGGTVTSSTGIVGAVYDGTATITGHGSQWLIGGDLVVADYGGLSTLSIVNGGRVTSSSGTLGRTFGNGHVTVSGADSQWSDSGELNVGFEGGSGTLIIKNGGLVTSHIGTISSGPYADVFSTATVAGQGSRWKNDSDLTVGLYNSAGVLIVENSGVVEVDGLLTLEMHGTLSGNGGTIIGDMLNQGTIAPGNSPGILTIDGDLHSTGLIQIQLAGTGTGYFDQLIVTGDLNLGGTIEVDLLDGFMPFTHNSFQIMNFGSLINSGYRFDFSHAALQPSFSWDTSTFAVDGTIRVIPEASSVLLVGIATFAGLLVARVSRR